MQVGLVGSGAVLSVVAEQVALTDASVTEVEPNSVETVDLAVVAGSVGEALFDTVNDAAIAAEIPLLSIERGGIGGVAAPDVSAGLAVLAPDGPCLSCLRRRVASTGGGDAASDDPPDTVDRIVGAHAGALAVEIIRSDGEPAAGRVITFPHRERTVLPVPGCAACDQAWTDRWASPPDRSSRTLSRAIEQAERCLDELFGLVTEIGEAASMPLPYYLASVADTSAFGDARAPPHAAGVSEDWDQAYMKGIGEALERYAAATFRDGLFRTAHPDSLDSRLHPAECVRPASRDPIDDPIAWVPGADLATGADRWIPADLVVFPPSRSPVRPPITSGLALGNTAPETALAGLLEIIERDATMLAWYSTFEPVGLAIDDPGFDRLQRRARTEDLETSVVLLTQDVDVPVVGAFVRRPGEFPRFAAGSAAGFDATAVAKDALREALQNWMELAEMGNMGAADEAPRLADYATDPETLDPFVAPDVEVDAAGLVESPPTDPSEALDRLVAEVTSANMRPSIAWLTTRDLRSVGFVAARVVVPSAQPLLLDTIYFGERARTVPESMGFAPRLDRDPHPFP